VLTLLTCGCRVYRASPVDLATHLETWDQRESAQAPGERSDARITLEQGLLLAERFHPRLRELRASLDVSLARTGHPPRMADPRLEFDVERALENLRHPWNTGASLGIEIPTSGSRAALRELDRARVDAAQAELAAAVWNVRREVRNAWYRWSADVRRLALFDRHLASLSVLVETVRGLDRSGELPPASARVIEIEQRRRAIDRQVARERIAVSRAALLERLGLPSGASVEPRVDLGPGAARDVPPRAMRIASPHPRVAALLAEHAVAEARLRREIRKQFPDVSLGGGAENDDGQSRLTLGLGIPLPVWNRNARGIALAMAEREAAAVRVRAELERSESALEGARLRAAEATARRRALETSLLPLVERQLDEVRGLIEVGEVDVLLLREALARALDTRLDLLDATLEEARAINELDHRIGPGTKETEP